MWLIDNGTVVTNNNDNIHVQWRAIGHNALLVFTHNYALFTLGSLVVMYMPSNNNQVGCGFTACSVGAARKPQQYNYNSLWL